MKNVFFLIYTVFIGLSAHGRLNEWALKRGYFWTFTNRWALESVVFCVSTDTLFYKKPGYKGQTFKTLIFVKPSSLEYGSPPGAFF